MGRPRKQTVEYFNHDVFASEGKTLTIIKGQFGLAGLGFWWELLAILGRTEGHYFDARKDDDLEFLTRKIGTDIVSGAEILDKLAKLEAIDPVLWQHRVIWCQNFVDRLTEVYVKRQSPVPLKPCFCNGNCNHVDTNGVISVTETPVFGSETPHSIVKESIVEETKVNNTKAPPKIPPQETAAAATTTLKDDLKPVALVDADSAEQDYNLTAIIKCYENNFGMVSPIIADELKKLSQKYSAEWFTEAVKEALVNESRNLKYVTKILDRWAIEGFKTPLHSRAGPGAKCNDDQDKYVKGKYGHMVQR